MYIVYGITKQEFMEVALERLFRHYLLENERAHKKAPDYSGALNLNASSIHFSLFPQSVGSTE